MVAAGVPYWRLSGFYFFYFAFLGAWLPYWNLYLKSLGYSLHMIGVLSSIMLGTKIVGPSVWGYLADRSGRRMAVIRFGCFAAAASFALVLFDQRLALMASVIFFYSFFWNAVLSQYEVVTLSHLEGHHTLYSRIRVWGSVGFIIAVGLFGLVFDHLPIGYLPPMLLVLLVLIALSSLFVFEQRSIARPVASGGLWQIVRQPPVWAFLLSCFLMQVAHGPYYTFFSIFMEQHGYSRAAIGALWSLGVVAEVVLFMVMHRVMARYSLRHILLATWVLAAVRWVMTGYGVESLPVLLLAQCLHAASFGSFHAAGIEMMRRFFAHGHQGQGQALYSGLSYGAGGAVGAILAGYAWDIAPQATFLLATVVSVLALLLTLLLLRGPQLESVHGASRVAAGDSAI